MDKLAKRVAIAATVFAAASVIVLGVGLLRMGSKLEQDSASSKPAEAAKLANALTLAEEPVAAPAPAPVPAPAAAAPAQQDLAAAFGNALGVEVKKTQAQTPTPGAAAPTPPPNAPSPSKASTSSDSLDLGFSASKRDAKLSSRDAKPLDVRQTGGEKAQLKQEKPSESISFETDLGKAR
jgi:hypothetical protein